MCTASAGGSVGHFMVSRADYSFTEVVLQVSDSRAILLDPWSGKWQPNEVANWKTFWEILKMVQMQELLYLLHNRIECSSSDYGFAQWLHKLKCSCLHLEETCSRLNWTLFFIQHDNETVTAFTEMGLLGHFCHFCFTSVALPNSWCTIVTAFMAPPLLSNYCFYQSFFAVPFTSL